MAEENRLRPPGRPHQAYTHGSECLRTHIVIYIYIAHIYAYMLHAQQYINYAENRESRSHMKNTDLTTKYHVKVTVLGKP